MDEPVSNLDAKLRSEMRTELKRLHMDTNSTFIYVTHDQMEAMTLSTKVCLMENGILQQFAPPLEIYNKPGNIFVADFMGNPNINFIEAKVLYAEGNTAEVEFCGLRARYKTKEALNIKAETAILGIRPEHIAIGDKGAKVHIYATLPTGMETTVKLKLDNIIISAIVFGSVDYEVDKEVAITIIYEKILMFDKESKERIGIGRLELL